LVLDFPVRRFHLLLVKQDIIDRLREVTPEVFAGSPVFLAYAYGSRMHGSPRPDSDLDVGYYQKGFPNARPLSLHDELTLEAALSDGIGMSVDLRDLGRAPLELRGRVLEEGARVYCTDRVGQVTIEREVLARYHDYKDVFRQMHELRLRRVAEVGLT